MKIVSVVLRRIRHAVDLRIDVFAARRYHRAAYRSFRMLAVNEPDPRIARFYEAQARAHRYFVGPIEAHDTIEH